MAGAAAALSLAGCAPKGSSENAGGTASASTEQMTSAYTTIIPDSWDGEADVVVCGGGGAGLNAAFSAAENGASVIVLEKGGHTGGTCALAEGAIQASGTPWQKELSFDTSPNAANNQHDTPEMHAKDWMLQGEGLLKEDVVSDMLKNSADDLQWMVDNFGVTYVRVFGAYPTPYSDPANMADRAHIIADAADPTQEGGRVWMANAAKACEEKDVQIETNAEAATLVMDGKTVVGVLTANGDAYKANKGVILATGGIDHNEEMARDLNPHHYWVMKHGKLKMVAENTGDGIRMGMALGAAFTQHGTDDDMDDVFGYLNNSNEEVNYLLVNQMGTRFVREDTSYGYHMRSVYDETVKWGGDEGQCWTIMDDQMLSVKECYFCDDSIYVDDGKAYREDAIANGLLFQASSVADLASKTGLPAEALQRTVDHWNEMAAAGSDTDFGRVKHVEALDAAHLWAWKVQDGSTGAFGGLVIDPDCKVMTWDGQTFPNLFAAGNCSGGWIGSYYAGSGQCLLGCAHLGRKSGKVCASL